MEYIYATMLLHKAGQNIDVDSVTKVLESASVKVDDIKLKALIASLKNVDIDGAAERAAVPISSAPIVERKVEHKEDKKNEDKVKKTEEEKKSENAAASGLERLFGKG